MTVKTYLHQLQTHMDPLTGKLAVENPEINEFFGKPIYVVDKDAMELLQRADCEAAIKAMHEANILRLPDPVMVIELHVQSGSPAATILNGPDVTKSLANEYKDPEDIAEFVMLREGVAPNGAYSILIDYAFMYVKSKIAGVCSDRVYLSFKNDGIEMTFSNSASRSTVDAISSAGVVAINCALVLMNMSGIERDHESFPKLNKARERTGKSKIPDYTYLRIGHVQRADGTRVKYNSGDVRTMPMHVRSAHTRRQHYGPNNELTKLIYVPSVIVNFNPGEKMRQKVRIVK